MTHVFPGFLAPVLTQLFFPKPPTTFLTCFCRGKRRKYVGKKVRLNQGSNSQPPGHESDKCNTEPLRWGQKILESGGKHFGKRKNCSIQAISPFPTVFSKDLYCRHVKTRSCLGKDKASFCGLIVLF